MAKADRLGRDKNQRGAHAGASLLVSDLGARFMDVPYRPLKEEFEYTLPVGVTSRGTLRYQGHERSVQRLAWSPDGRFLATPSWDGTLALWDVASRQVILAVSCSRNIRSVALGGEGGATVVAGGNFDGLLVLDVAERSMHGAVGGRDASRVTFVPGTTKVLVAASPGWVIADLLADVELTGGQQNVGDVAVRPLEQLSFVTSSHNGLQFWDSSDQSGSGSLSIVQEIRTTSICSSVVAPSGSLVFAGFASGILHVYEDGHLRAEMEGHTEGINDMSCSADGRLLATKSGDGMVCLWSTETLERLAIFGTGGNATGRAGLAFHPSESLLAVTAHLGGRGLSADVKKFKGESEHNSVLLLDIDLDLLAGAGRVPVVKYATAKLVLLGDSGVGKTGLGWRLTQGEFRDHPSTHGQQFWVFDELGENRADGSQCEAVVWDLAGQPDYRIVHSLFINDADAALVLFDDTREDPLGGVDYWLRRFSGSGVRVVLVAARSDRGTGRLSDDEIERFRRERGIEAFIRTSAALGDGLEALISHLRDAVRWDERPATVTTATFKWIKEQVLALKESEADERVVLSSAELRGWLEEADTSREFSDAELRTAVGHLATHGYVTWLRTSGGEDRLLLKPELLNNLAASIVLEARRNERGLGSVEEQRVLTGGFAFPELDGLTEDERESLLDSAVALFLKHNVCFRETDPLRARAFLVFPELINMRRPAMKDAVPLEEGVAYTVTGAVENVYASLVVLLGYTDVFTRTNQWRDQAEYVVGDGLVCGFRLEREAEGELQFVLSFGRDVGSPVRRLFQGLFESFLAGRQLTVQRLEPVVCGNGHTLNRAAVREQQAEDASAAFCTRCGLQVPLPRTDEPLELTTDVVDERRTAGRRSRFEQALFRLKAYAVEDDAAQPTCFVSYAWGDTEHERWVEKELANDLLKAGIAVVLDRWENSRIGSSVPRFVERVLATDRVVVVGTRAYREKYENGWPMGGYVAAAEGDLIGVRMIGTEQEKASVLPIVVEGMPREALPDLLQGRVFADFRERERYFLAAFDLAVSAHGLAADDAVARQLRETLT